MSIMSLETFYYKLRSQSLELMEPSISLPGTFGTAIDFLMRVRSEAQKSIRWGNFVQSSISLTEEVLNPLVEGCDVFYNAYVRSEAKIDLSKLINTQKSLRIVSEYYKSQIDAANDEINLKQQKLLEKRTHFEAARAANNADVLLEYYPNLSALLDLDEEPSSHFGDNSGVSDLNVRRANKYNKNILRGYMTEPLFEEDSYGSVNSFVQLLGTPQVIDDLEERILCCNRYKKRCVELLRVIQEFSDDFERVLKSDCLPQETIPPNNVMQLKP